MPSSTIETASFEDSITSQKQHNEGQILQVGSLRNYALVGLTAVAILSLIEWVDLNIKLTPIFESFSERLALTAYLSLNLVAGAITGLIIGLVARAASWLNARLQRLTTRNQRQTLAHRLLAGLVIAAIAGGLLYFQPGVFRFTLGAIREAEKISLARLLLKAERLFTYLSITGMLICCWAVWRLARASMNKLLRATWLVLILGIISVAYYIDSRIEVQQYEFSLHRAMFLVEVTLAMAFVVSARGLFPRPLRSPNCIALFCVAALVCAGAAFTFANFDRNQNLKTQVFYRSTITKQFFKLTQWALDFDRDGFSAVLGGGDADDRRADINPGQIEIPGDGIDNNCIGGDLSREDAGQWLDEQRSLNTAPNPGAHRFNVLYVFVDTVRADHLSLYGYPRNTTPGLSWLAERGSVFENAFTPSPSTYQAVPKFMQSSYWDAHLETWTEVLARAGYDTVLFPGRRAATLYRRIKDPAMISSARTGNFAASVDAVIDRFSKAQPDHPVCAYLYAFEPHMPYKLRRDFYFGPAMADLYDGEIAYADSQLARLFNWLEQSGRLRDTMIVIMSDHGESLGERGVRKHNAQLYNEQMHVPAIIYVPNLGPRRISEFVSTIDLGSTILNTVGVACPKEYAGASLVPLMRGDAFTAPPVYGEHWQRNDSPFFSPEHDVDPEIHKYMVITQDGFKLIYNQNANCFELFNLRDDPKEQHNLYDRTPEKSAELKRLLGRFVDVVLVSRPPDADEQRYFRGMQDEEEEK
ncbi:MAG TPA: sulfatase-like hydrolase/transferase [Blastocatellia bacterium]|nr:sulfatase-like hydrolase/transferase [Blastocatellia bacterium]